MRLVTFEKYEGLGNDFILVDLGNDLSIACGLPEKVKNLCDRRIGVGADGVILIYGDHNNDARIEIYNSDGSRPEMCGNGIRCVANYLTSRDGNLVTRILTDAGVKVCRLSPESGEVTVEMGRANFEPSSLPCITDQKSSLSLKIGGFDLVPVSMGNPHAVIFTDSNPDEMAKAHGPALEVASCFPKRCNIEFAKQVGPNHFQVGVWERGCGITLACGTGACAVAAAALKAGRVGSREEVKIDLPGGTLWIDPSKYDETVLMRGPAKKVYVGKINLN